LHEIAAMTGVNLPSYLGDLQKNKDVAAPEENSKISKNAK
jgi:hypothetical protein